MAFTAFDHLTCSTGRAITIQRGRDLANRNGAPVGVWERDGWYLVCEEPPDDMEPSPESEGWQLVAIVEPDDKAVR